MKMNALRPIPPSKVLFLSCTLFGVKEEEIVTFTRRPRVVAARTVFCGIAREVLEHSYPDLSEFLCGRRHSHTTVLTADQRWRRMGNADEIMAGITKHAAREYVMQRLAMHGKEQAK